jgi:hypothetical protein
MPGLLETPMKSVYLTRTTQVELQAAVRFASPVWIRDVNVLTER